MNLKNILILITLISITNYTFIQGVTQKKTTNRTLPSYETVLLHQEQRLEKKLIALTKHLKKTKNELKKAQQRKIELLQKKLSINATYGFFAEPNLKTADDIKRYKAYEDEKITISKKIHTAIKTIKEKTKHIKTIKQLHRKTGAKLRLAHKQILLYKAQKVLDVAKNEVASTEKIYIQKKAQAAKKKSIYEQANLSPEEAQKNHAAYLFAANEEHQAHFKYILAKKECSKAEATYNHIRASK